MELLEQCTFLVKKINNTRQSIIDNVDKFEGENNVNHNGIVKIAPLYTEVVFKYQVINHEIKLN